MHGGCLERASRSANDELANLLRLPVHVEIFENNGAVLNICSRAGCALAEEGFRGTRVALLVMAVGRAHVVKRLPYGAVERGADFVAHVDAVLAHPDLDSAVIMPFERGVVARNLCGEGKLRLESECYARWLTDFES